MVQVRAIVFAVSAAYKSEVVVSQDELNGCLSVCQ